MNRMETSAYKYAFDVEIAATVERVWKTLTLQIGTWWPSHFNSSEETKQFVLEPRVGGRMFEDLGGDDGVLWGTVVSFQTNKQLQIQGPMFPDYGGPGAYILKLELQPNEAGCRLLVSDSMYGHVSEETLESTQAGWKVLFGEHLKHAAEAD